MKVDSIAALLPREIASSGTLVVGADTSYAPAEYLDVDGVTPVGYDVDLAKAIAVVLGLEADVRTADFSSIIPEVGSTYDVGISSFTINAERMAQVNMVQYLEAGEAFAVEKGNPQGISRDDLCGVTVAVQAGTIQEEELGTLTEECESAGKESIRRLSFDTQTEATRRSGRWQGRRRCTRTLRSSPTPSRCRASSSSSARRSPPPRRASSSRRTTRR